jgi:hypothetical protein
VRLRADADGADDLQFGTGIHQVPLDAVEIARRYRPDAFADFAQEGFPVRRFVRLVEAILLLEDRHDMGNQFSVH